ncbi:hypothetical protein SAMN04489761_3383 [Tenacibaculum sp. MAR_2009_124]|uniref:hypothetical protein n=1 Tax=Tenacibaculum sp. MAR_2009_124 TaxID=1250059 RepID=UPI00089563D0|nr:hypothetical protein [Tenacibaculum sp. MAR_2009_124]SEC64527.1 hypothetical protein SAMN04489761_3383 [Tenacibaculum sp. MAR_2009_124]
MTYKHFYLTIMSFFFAMSIGCSSVEKTAITSKTSYTTLNGAAYYNEVSIADSLFMNQSYRASFNKLNFLLNNGGLKNSFRNSEYRVYMLTKHYLGKQITRKDFELLIAKYGIIEPNIKSDTLLFPYYQKSGITPVIYKELRSEYLKSLDLELRDSIILMVEKDQYYRVEYYGDDRLEKRKQIDIKHEKVLIDLFEKEIYPSQEVVGNYFVDNKFIDTELLLLHTQDSIRLKYFLPKIRKFILEKKCSPYLYANMVDQYQLYNEKEQIYGSYNIAQLEEKDFSRYNRNRKLLGLGLRSVEYDIWRDKLIRSKYYSK